MREEAPAVTVRLHVETPHGERVRGAAVVFGAPGVLGDARAEEIDGVYTIEIPAEGDFELLVEAGDGRGTGAAAFDHVTLRATLRSGAGGPPTLTVAAPPGQATRIDEASATSDGWALRIVLDYLWFTPVGTPPTLGNRAAVLIDGEEAWGAVADAIEASTEHVNVTTWFYQETAELRRPKPLAEPGERAANTAHRVLADTAARGVLVRLLLWDAPFHSLAEGAQALAHDDNFEVLQEANLTEGNLLRADEHPMVSELVGTWPLYSFHQKTVVVDGKVGFCGGMNLRENDWDSPKHALFDPRRTRFSRVSSFRKLVLGRTAASDHAPRHDIMARVAGPAVEHLEANFRERWNRVRTQRVRANLLAEEDLQDDEQESWKGSTPIPRPLPAPPSETLAGGSAVQVVRTMPAPYDERGVLDVYVRAIRAARRLIYIEHQFFRSTQVSDAIAEAVRARPDLVVIVVTVRSYADSVLQSGWSWECFRRVQAERPDFELYTLVVTEVDSGIVHTREVDIHAKLMMVDDVFLTLGSCNLHDRGFELEGEINLAVVDPALVRATRLRLWREHLANDARLTGEIERDLGVWQEHADRNRDPNTAGTSNVVPFVPIERESVFDRHTW
ncbi:MAG: phosphatidylserine/phosphatidylglycerophosphate/cardiolipin synthase family protein [Pseudomonadota bacterium]|nr:phosphatidylserine/phosphatidylglycerophosphate/cardiolipin synthase family protein [Pseudomonadota bacterium]